MTATAGSATCPVAGCLHVVPCLGLHSVCAYKRGSPRLRNSIDLMKYCCNEKQDPKGGKEER